jgi:hypothetical protein
LAGVDKEKGGRDAGDEEGTRGIAKSDRIGKGTSKEVSNIIDIKIRKN